jgi:3-phenylpropionate/trans-cinnamate dioxygenase ferredoxin component
VKSFVPIMALAELPVGRMRRVRHDGKDWVLCHTAQGVHALAALCSHADQGLDTGWIKGTRVVCPLHGAEFDVRSGGVVRGPATLPVECRPVRISEAGIIEIESVAAE